MLLLILVFIDSIFRFSKSKIA